MNAAIGTTHRHSDPLGVVAALCGVAGFAATVVLWLSQMRPDSRFLGGYLPAVATGADLREDLIVLAGLLGLTAILGAFLSSLGGPARKSAVVALLLGALALIYPVLAWQGVVGVPVAPTSFTGL
jgi:hypothetical protein